MEEEEDRLLLPLLSSAGVVSGWPENDLTSSLSGEAKMEKLANFLFALLCKLPEVTGEIYLLAL
jgi:hypothetical protein